MKHLKEILKFVLFLSLANILMNGIVFFVVMWLSGVCGASPNARVIIASVSVTLFIVLFSCVSYCDDLQGNAKSELDSQWKSFYNHKKSEDSRLKAEHQILDKRHQTIIELENDFHNLLDSTQQSYPWLAQEIADFLYINDENVAKELRNKKRPAVKASDEVKAIAKEKRKLQVKCKEQEYQLAYYETLFPWLEEFKELPPAVGAEYAEITQSSSDDEYDSLRKWLSPEEYAELSTAEKFQLALERYKTRPKNDWEVGIEYERYIGYRYETEGYSVRFHGALMGKQDMGRDLIASKNGRTLIIQCKRWSKSKTIHEKHIFQLYGSAVQMAVEEGKECFPVFITTATLSDTARKCAEYLHIDVAENFAFADYPMIKCNISRDGEKIYHLPFDQQYDRVRIRPGTGETYVSTVAEAESLGFRRAYRWHGPKATV